MFKKLKVRRDRKNIENFNVKNPSEDQKKLDVVDILVALAMEKEF